MNLKTFPIWLQVLVGLLYGSVAGLCLGYLFSMVALGVLVVLSRIISAVAFAS